RPDRADTNSGVPLLAPASAAAYFPPRMKSTPPKPPIPPLPAVVLGMISVQAGAALAKGLFPALGPLGTVGLRIGLSALILLAAFRPRLHPLRAAQWPGVIPARATLR